MTYGQIRKKEQDRSKEEGLNFLNIVLLASPEQGALAQYSGTMKANPGVPNIYMA